MRGSYDLAVVGSGPGGFAAAMTAARRGLKVALIERDQWGGVCLNIGCIPTKALITVGRLKRRIQQASRLGLKVSDVQVDYPAVMARNERIVTTLRDGLVGLLRRLGVEMVCGQATLDDAQTLIVQHDGTTQRVGAQQIILATGARPHPGPWGFDGVARLSYRDALHMSSLPSSLLIIGGGVIGCEFASCFSGFGVPVTLVEQQAQMLPGEDPEAVRVLAHSLQSRGVAIHVGTTVTQMAPSASGLTATLANGSTVTAERCLIAIGMIANSHGLGLESLGIDTEGGIAVNEFLLTTQPHVAAIGDCLRGHGLAHLAGAEGVLAVDNLCGSHPASLNHQLVPRGIYTDPEIAQVGVTESGAPGSARVSRFAFAALGKALCDDEPEGFVKLIVEEATGRILGGTIVGAHASDLIHLVVLAMSQGLTARQLARTITAHPTWPEAVSEAASQLYGESLSSALAARAPRNALLHT